MSHTPMNQNIPNGMVSHQWTPGKSAPLIQQNVSQNYSGSSINGLQNSTHSSRDPSPHTWKYQPSALNQIPASQLPPGMKSNMSQGKISTNSSNPVDKTVDVKLMNSQKQNANILLSQVQDTPKNILLAPMNVNSMAPSLVTNLHNSSSVQLLGPLPQTSPSENMSSKTNNQSSHGSFQASSMSTGSISSSKINNINTEHQNKVQSSSLVSSRNDKFVSKASPMHSNTIEPVMQQMKQVSLEASDNSVNKNQNLSTGVLNNSNLIQQVSTVSPKIASVSQVDSNKSFISNKSQNSLSDRSSKIFVSAQDSVLKPSIIASTPNLSTPHSQNNNLSSHSMTNVNSAVSSQANSTIGVQGKIIPNYISGGLQSSSGVSNVLQSATGIATHNFDQKQNLPVAPPIGTTATPPPNIQWFPHSNSPQLQPNYPNMQTRPEFVASDVRQYSGMQNTDEQVGRVLNLNQPQSASVSNLSQPPPYSKSNQQYVSNVLLNQSNQRIEGHSGLTQKQVSTMSQPREQTLNSNQQPHSSMQQPVGQAVNVNNQMQLPESIQGLSVPPSLNNQQFGSSQIQTSNKSQIQQQQTLNKTQNVSSLLTHNQSISDKQKPSGFSSDSINNSNQSQQFNLNASQLIKPPMSCASTASSGYLDNKPPIMQPPTVQPPMVQPPMVQPPMVQPPMVQPSMIQPSMMQPSMVQPPSGFQNISNNPPVLTSTNQFSATHNSPIGKRYPTKMPSYDNQQMNANQMPQFQDFSTNSANSMRYQRNDKFQTNQEFYVQQSQGNAAQPAYQQQANYNQYGQLNVTQSGFNRLWGHESVDLLQNRNILPSEKIEAPSVCLVQECLNAANCSPDIFRCTMTKIPESSSLLNKSRLPLGVLIHPFRDLNHLPVIQCSSIVRCRSCRTYINPFVYFVDTKRWKCNLCYRVNELPEEFQYDPVSKSYGDPSRRPEIKSSTIEYIAPSEYMLRPPQPAIYLFVLDISRLAIESGYLQILCNTLADELDNLPGDSRTQVGFLCFNSALHFYSLADGLNQPHEMTVVDIDDVFLPCPDNLLVNLKERKELIKDLLSQLPTRFVNSHDNGSALGAALQAAFKMISPTGGRVTVFQCTLPTIGPGALTSREVPSQRSNSEVAHLNPATDFYKRLALDCSAHQVAVDLFVLNSQYVDLSTISGISRFSAGCMHHWPLFKASRIVQAQQFYYCLRRYLTRKIGYEAVMRIRCTRGLSIHTFHGNFFVRSTDLLSLPNCNPDSGFGMQVSIEENLSDLQTVCFQAALLYTSSKGERRIRVHTLCLPVVATLTEVLNSADEQCIIGILAKMAVDRSFQSSLADARDAFINAVIDILSAYKLSLNQGSVGSGLLASHSLKLLPLYIVALLKYTAFRTGTSTRLDDRVFAMCEMKTLPLTQLIQQIYPDLYPVHCLTEDGGVPTEDGRIIPQPSRLQLSAEKLDSRGAFLLDCGQHMMLYIGHNVAVEFLNSTLGYPHFEAIPDECYELPKTSTPENDRLHLFISSLNDEKPYPATIQILRDNSPFRIQFTEKLIEDRIENALSYYEFLQHLKTHVK